MSKHLYTAKQMRRAARSWNGNAVRVGRRLKWHRADNWRQRLTDSGEYVQTRSAALNGDES